MTVTRLDLFTAAAERLVYGYVEFVDCSVQLLLSDEPIWIRPITIDSFAGCALSMQRGRCGTALLVQVAQLRENAVEEAARILIVTDQGRIAEVEAHEIGKHGVKGRAQPLLDSQDRVESALRLKHLGCLCEKILTRLSCGKFFGIVHLQPSAPKLLLAGSLYSNSSGLKSTWRATSSVEIER